MRRRNTRARCQDNRLSTHLNVFQVSLSVRPKVCFGVFDRTVAVPGSHLLNVDLQVKLKLERASQLQIQRHGQVSSRRRQRARIAGYLCQPCPIGFTPEQCRPAITVMQGRFNPFRGLEDREVCEGLNAAEVGKCLGSVVLSDLEERVVGWAEGD